MEATEHNEHLGPSEAARRLGVSTWTLNRWERDGTISAYRTPGGQRRFRAADIEALAAERDES
jgi:excisionase family DNA binding protein